MPETIPFFAAAAPLSVIPDVTNQKGNVFGFANDAGRSVAIRCGLQLTGTLVELFFDKNQAPVAGGHSGSPVWNAVQQVIGMLIEGDEDSGDDTSPKAYMLPAAQFEFALSGFRSEVSQKVQKCKPKKIPQTDAIFEQVHRTNSEADDSETTLRISLDTKATVKLGEFSRGGKSRQPQQAADHDFEPDTSLTPFGILQPDTGESHIWFSGGKVTADLMADCLEEMLPKWQAKQTVTELVINADNGPESTGHRTQWLNRLVEMADDHQITIKLAYYPPYHSTYNPVERLWGILENHWRGELLDSVQKTLGLARSMTFKGIRPKLKKIRRVYKSGITVAKKAMREIEARLERKEGLESWYIGKDR